MFCSLHGLPGAGERAIYGWCSIDDFRRSTRPPPTRPTSAIHALGPPTPAALAVSHTLWTVLPPVETHCTLALRYFSGFPQLC